MKPILIGHDYKYAAEQIALVLFPEAWKNTREQTKDNARSDARDRAAKRSAENAQEYTQEYTQDNKREYEQEFLNGHAKNGKRSADDEIRADELIIESRLSTGRVYAQATAFVTKNGVRHRGIARVRSDSLTNKLVTDRALQRIIKQSIFRAALGVLDKPPVWGSLTGIRPAKLVIPTLEKSSGDERRGELSGECENERKRECEEKGRDEHEGEHRDHGVELSGDERSGENSGERAARLMLTRDYYVSNERAVMCVEAAKHAIAVKRSLSPRDIALYVGIPFCPTRCAYCSFVSNSVEKSFDLIEPFTQTLLTEINLASMLVKTLGLNVIAVYIGGGTPTSLPDDSLRSVMTAIRDSFDLSCLREYTVEAGRPDTITPQKIEIMRNLGAERICVNPQSLSQEVLRAIGRAHTPEDVLAAMMLVKQSGAAVNMDLIAGLPGDTADGFSSTLEGVLALKPENITIHTLSLKKGSRVMLENTVIPSGAAVSEMLEHASNNLRDNGYEPYYLYRQKYTSGGFENTGWTKPGHVGIYNICMMEELTSVLAIGGGGVTKLVSPEGRIERVFNAKYPREYIMNALKLQEKFNKITEFLQCAV